MPGAGYEGQRAPDDPGRRRPLQGQLLDGPRLDRAGQAPRSTAARPPGPRRSRGAGALSRELQMISPTHGQRFRRRIGCPRRRFVWPRLSEANRHKLFLFAAKEGTMSPDTRTSRERYLTQPQKAPATPPEPAPIISPSVEDDANARIERIRRRDA